MAQQLDSTGIGAEQEGRRRNPNSISKVVQTVSPFLDLFLCNVFDRFQRPNIQVLLPFSSPNITKLKDRFPFSCSVGPPAAPHQQLVDNTEWNFFHYFPSTASISSCPGWNLWQSRLYVSGAGCRVAGCPSCLSKWTNSHRDLLPSPFSLPCELRNYFFIWLSLFVLLGISRVFACLFLVVRPRIFPRWCNAEERTHWFSLSLDSPLR